MKKIIVLIIFFLTFLSFGFVETKANDDISNESVNLYLFYSESCPHCHEERNFLKNYNETNPGKIKLNEYEINKNRKLFEQISELLNKKSPYVPYLVVSDEVIIGYNSDDTTGAQIIKKVDNCLASGCYDPVYCEIINPGACEDRVDVPEKVDDLESEKCTDMCEEEDDPIWIKIPIIGKRVNIAELSLPVVSVFLGVVDGFNPCAMWILIFLISLLIKVEDKKKRWALGAIFIFFSGLVYFAALAGWSFIFSLLKAATIVNVVVGAIALVSGSNFLYKYYKNEIKCEAVDMKQRSQIMKAIDNVVNGKRFWQSAILLSVIAIGVNLLELYCSIGLPMIFANLLENTGTSTTMRYVYMLVYIFFYMLDDLLIFTVSMITLQVSGVGTKYLRYVNLIGGTLLILIGLALIINPKLLAV